MYERDEHSTYRNYSNTSANLTPMAPKIPPEPPGETDVGRRRYALGLTVRELAKNIRVGENTLRKLEAGGTVLPATLNRINTALTELES